MYNKDKLKILLVDLISYMDFNEENIKDKSMLYDLLKKRVEYVSEEILKLYKLN